MIWDVPDSKVHGANMGPIWGRQDPGGPHVGPMNFAIWGILWVQGLISAQSFSAANYVKYAIFAMKSMGQCKKDVTPVCYVFLALSHRNMICDIALLYDLDNQQQDTIQYTDAVVPVQEFLLWI